MQTTFMLLSKGEIVLQGVILTLTEIGRCYGVQMNVINTKVKK